MIATTTSQAQVMLTEEQEAAVDWLLCFTKDVQTLGGYAGTGKSTVARVLKERLPGLAVCCPTAKAADVLRRKGVGEAGTIHSLIYHPVERERIDENGQRRREVTYVLKEPWEVPGSGFLVDEASMVGKDLHDALCSFGRPIIYVGDHGQLPPVNDKDFNLMATPDVVLEQIHRNAGPVAHFAGWLRRGGAPAAWPGLAEGGRSADGSVWLTDFAGLCAGEGLDGPDQFLCAFNRYRVALNRAWREELGFPDGRPVAGDKIVCLQNDRRAGLFNGMVGTVKAVLPGDRMVFSCDGQDYAVRYLPEQFHREAPPSGRDRLGRIAFDFAYFLTCHKSQGSEWDYVAVVEQRCGGWDHGRWCYTAATRARRRLTWVTA